MEINKSLTMSTDESFANVLLEATLLQLGNFIQIVLSDAV